MQPWLIPTIYAATSISAGFLVPRLESKFVAYSLNLSTSSAQAYLSAVASGMIALTGIVFSIAFVLVQFNAIVYSPRLVVWFARDRLLFHSLGMFPRNLHVQPRDVGVDRSFRHPRSAVDLGGHCRGHAGGERIDALAAG